MGYVTTERTKAMKFRQEWRCDDCEHEWLTEGENRDPPAPDCPLCEVAPLQVFKPIAIRGNAHRALAVAETMMERDYGLTNMRDHLQAGENAAMAPPPIQTAEAEAIAREIINQGGVPALAGDRLKPLVQNFFGANGSAQTGPNPFGVPTTIDAARAMAAPAAAESRAMAADPVGLLHEAGKKGLDPVSRKNLQIMSKGT